MKLAPCVKVVKASKPDGVRRLVWLQHVSQILNHHVGVIVSLKNHKA